MSNYWISGRQCHLVGRQRHFSGPKYNLALSFRPVDRRPHLDFVIIFFFLWQTFSQTFVLLHLGCNMAIHRNAERKKTRIWGDNLWPWQRVHPVSWELFQRAGLCLQSRGDGEPKRHHRKNYFQMYLFKTVYWNSKVNMSTDGVMSSVSNDYLYCLYTAWMKKMCNL